LEQEGFSFGDALNGIEIYIEGRNNNGDIVKLQRMDGVHKGNPGFDFLLERNGTKQFIEVKGSVKNAYELTRAQHLLALQCYCNGTESLFRLILLNKTGVVLDCDNVISTMNEERLELIPQILRIA
jgi:hypothetical protein